MTHSGNLFIEILTFHTHKWPEIRVPIILTFIFIIWDQSLLGLKVSYARMVRTRKVDAGINNMSSNNNMSAVSFY